jgi:predicted cobalt transporter CbtA
MLQSGSGAGIAAPTSGVAVADLHQRQLWWAATVIATAVGVWLIAGRRRTWLLRSCGAMCLLLPHLIGTPVATGQNSVPAELVRRFSIASVATSGIFWLPAGTLGGLIYTRNQADA